MFGLVVLECNSSLEGQLGGGEDEDRATDFLLGEVTGVNPSESVRTRSEDLDRRVRPRVGSRNLDCPPIDLVSMAKSRATLARPPLLDLVFFFCLGEGLVSESSIWVDLEGCLGPTSLTGEDLGEGLVSKSLLDRRGSA